MTAILILTTNGYVEFSASVHMLQLRQHHQPLNGPLVAIRKLQSQSHRVNMPLPKLLQT